MNLFPGYWTTAEFSGQLGALGWIQEPRVRTWDPTTRWQQMLTYSGPATNTELATGVIVGDYQSKPFQLSMQPEGPNVRLRVVYYSDDYAGFYPRDPLLTTWGLHANLGTESVLWCKKTMWAFREFPDLVRRVQVASLLYENALGPMTNTFWQNFKAPTTDMTALQNALFTRAACEDANGALIQQVNPFTPGTSAAPSDCTLWYANQLYRLLCKGVTSVPQFQYALRKTSVVFPRNKFGNVTIGSDFRTSYHRIGYAFSYNALVQSEPGLTDEMQQLLNVPSLPRFWWVKIPPSIDQTNDSRWMITQEFWGVEWFEPYLWPWVSVPGETFDTTNGQFDPTVFYDSVRTGDPIPSGVTLRGAKTAGCYQWPAAAQNAIFGNQDGTENLP